MLYSDFGRVQIPRCRNKGIFKGFLTDSNNYWVINLLSGLQAYYEEDKEKSRRGKFSNQDAGDICWTQGSKFIRARTRDGSHIVATVGAFWLECPRWDCLWRLYAVLRSGRSR